MNRRPGSPSATCARLRAAGRPAGSTRRRAAASSSSTFRVPNDGRFWPAMLTSAPSVLLSTSRSRMMSPSKVTRGVMLDVDADGLVVERRDRTVPTLPAAAERRERRGRHGNLVAEVQRDLLPFLPAQLRLGDQLGLRVALEERDDGRRHRQVEVGRADACRDRVQVETAGDVRRGSAAALPVPPCRSASAPTSGEKMPVDASTRRGRGRTASRARG